MYNKVYKFELLIYLMLAGTLTYAGLGVTMNYFNKKMFYSFAVPGFLLNFLCLYMRSYKSKQYEALIEPLYESEIQKYTKFLYDKGYE